MQIYTRPGFLYPYNLFISKIRLLIQITLFRKARIQMDISKKDRFSEEKATNYFPLHRENK